MEHKRLSKNCILGIPTVICFIFFIGTTVLSFILDNTFFLISVGYTIMHFLEFLSLVICCIKEKFQLYIILITVLLEIIKFIIIKM